MQSWITSVTSWKWSYLCSVSRTENKTSLVWSEFLLWFFFYFFPYIGQVVSKYSCLILISNNVDKSMTSRSKVTATAQVCLLHVLLFFSNWSFVKQCAQGSLNMSNLIEIGPNDGNVYKFDWTSNTTFSSNDIKTFALCIKSPGKQHRSNSSSTPKRPPSDRG